MKIERAARPFATEGSDVSVYHLVSQLITSLQPLAVKRNNILLNDIPRQLFVSADQNTMAYVLTQLVNTANSGAENQCIHIQAVTEGNQTMIRVKDMDTLIYHTLQISPSAVVH